MRVFDGQWQPYSPYHRGYHTAQCYTEQKCAEGIFLSKPLLRALLARRLRSDPRYSGLGHAENPAHGIVEALKLRVAGHLRGRQWVHMRSVLHSQNAFHTHATGQRHYERPVYVRARWAKAAYMGIAAPISRLSNSSTSRAIHRRGCPEVASRTQGPTVSSNEFFRRERRWQGWSHRNVHRVVC